MIWIWDSERSAVHVDTVALGLLALFVGTVGVDTYWYDITILRSAVAFGLFALVPGALFLTLVSFGPQAELRWLLYSVGTSLLSIMSVGLVLNLVLPTFGIQKPLSGLTLGVSLSLMVVSLAGAVRIADPVGRRVPVPGRKGVRNYITRWVDPRTFALLLLPPVAILSVAWLNRTGDNRPLLVLFVVIALVPFAVARDWIPAQWHSLAIWSIGLSLLWHKTFWRFYDFSGHASIVNVWKLGRWSITERGSVDLAATTPLLPNVTISPTFAHLGDVHIFTQIEVLNPVLVSIIPLGSFVVFRRVFDSKSAMLGASVLAFIHPFYFQLPPGGRAAMPILFLVLMSVVMTDGGMDPLLRKGLMIGFAAAVITAHYGASYFVMAALLVASGYMTLVKNVESYVLKRNKARPDGGDSSQVSRMAEAMPQRRTLSVIFLVLYVSITHGWYMYTFGGQKFRQFIIRVSTALTGFLSDGSLSGGTANRIARNYGAPSIQLSKLIYIVLAGLVAVGFLTMFVRRLFDEEWDVPEYIEEFVSLAAGLLVVFSLTFIFQAIWGGGRPMAITFSLTAAFAVFGVRSIGGASLRIADRLPGVFRSQSSTTYARGGPISHSVFALIIATLLILNTGVAAALVFGGFAPSNVPVTGQIASSDKPDVRNVVYKESDVASYAWLRNNGKADTMVFGDPLSRAMAKDWYAPLVTARTDPDRATSFNWNRDIRDLADHGGAVYVVLSGHNVEMRTIVLSDSAGYSYQRTGEEISRFRSTVTGQNIVYTTGASTVYIKGADE